MIKSTTRIRKSTGSTLLDQVYQKWLYLYALWHPSSRTLRSKFKSKPEKKENSLNMVPVFNPLVVDRFEDLVFTTQDPRSNNGDIMITRMAGNDVFRAVVDSSGILRGRKVLLYYYDGTPVVSMKEKLTSRRSRWKVSRADQLNELWFRVQKVLAFRPEFEVFPAGRRRREGCDYKIRGSYSNRTCSIRDRDNASIAQDYPCSF